MSGPSASLDLVSQMQENHSRNTSTLRAAGCTGPAKHVRCQKCGIFEPIVFWTPVKRSGDLLHLKCPSGCSTEYRYHLAAPGGAAAGDRIQPGGRWVLVPILAYMILMLLAATERGQALAAQAWTSSQARVAAIATGESTPSATRSGPRGGGAGVASGGRGTARPASRSGSAGASGTSRFTLPWRSSPTLNEMVATGDRRAEIEALIAGVAETYGPSTRAAIHTVEYLPELNLTRVVVETGVPAWRAYFAARLATLLKDQSSD